MYKITWNSFSKTTEANAHATLLDNALDNQLPLEHACGGFCACTTCHVVVTEGFENLSAIESDEAERLEHMDGRQPNSRLACQAKIKGNVTIA